jgi:nitrate reductase NapE component
MDAAKNKPASRDRILIYPLNTPVPEPSRGNSEAQFNDCRERRAIKMPCDVTRRETKSKGQRLKAEVRKLKTKAEIKIFCLLRLFAAKAVRIIRGYGFDSPRHRQALPGLNCCFLTTQL